MSSFIPLSVPHLVGNTAKYLEECVTSGYVSSVGKFVDSFEEELAAYTGTKHAVAVMNGTCALHLALICCGLKPNQEVLTPSLTFVATANAVRYAGAYPVLIDVSPDTWNIDTLLVESFLREQCSVQNGKLINSQSGREVVGILPVHLYGNPVDIPILHKLCTEFSLFLVEDAAQSIGAMLNGKMTGSFGNVGILSFNGNKTITAGAGGAIITDDETLAKHAKHLSLQAKQDDYRYIHDEIGFNYRMSNVQAAVGLAQLEQIEPFLEKKRAIHARYQDAFADLVACEAISFQQQLGDCQSQPTYWLNTICIRFPQFIDTEEPWKGVADALQEAQIQSRPLWYPLHLLEPQRDLQIIGGAVTEDLCRFGLCLPSSVSLTDAEQDRVVEVVLRLASGGV